MRYRRLGGGGLVVSELCLGSMTFGNGEGRFKPVPGVDQAGRCACRTLLGGGHQFLRYRRFLFERRIRTVEPLSDNLGASALELSAELASLDAISELPPEYPGWMAYKGINRSNVLELDPEARHASGYS